MRSPGRAYGRQQADVQVQGESAGRRDGRATKEQRNEMDQKTYRAVFFDLDGTLLPLDMDRFMGGYYLALKGFVAERGHDPKAFADALNAGIYAMAGDHPGVTNCDCFWSVFLERMGSEDAAAWHELLDEFYETDFGEIGSGMPPEPLSAEVVETLRAKGYPVALTTMPMFPIRATQWRLSWGDLDPAWFERITVYDNSTAIKPHPAYFEENLRAFGCRPEEVLMVGNNTKEDLACMKLGMPAYLVTDCLLNPNDFDVETVQHGTMEDFLAFVRTLPECENPASCTAPVVGVVPGAPQVSAGVAETAPKLGENAFDEEGVRAMEQAAAGVSGNVTEAGA